MVNNVVTGTYTETYDLNTAVGELSLLSIHTPQSNGLRRMFNGFFQQYKKFRIVKADMKMVCASKQELTPDLIGLEAGSVDPRDILNPILFKACTGETINALIDQIYNTSLFSANSGEGTTGSSSIGQVIDSRLASQDVYYQLLADDSWRKSHPQSGLTVLNLMPMVHKVVTTRPFSYVAADGQFPSINGSTPSRFGSDKATQDAVPQFANDPTVFVSNGMTNMPWLETTVPSNADTVTPSGSLPSSGAKLSVVSRLPRVFMGCVVLPPAILQPLYFRMQIRWTVQFRDFRPSQDLMPLDITVSGNRETGFPAGSQIAGLDGKTGNNVSTTYFNLYHQPSSKEVNPDSRLVDYSSFETNESAEVDQIMEKVQ